jgi:c-di-GMP-binding flagellar brake protein YcgR
VLPEEQRSRTEIDDRRRALRIDVPFHAKVNGVDSAGDHFSIETVLDNIGRNGLYMRMMPDVEMGAQLSIDVGLYTRSRITEDAPRFSVDGVVVRKEKRAGGAAGVAVTFMKARFP